MLVLPAPRPAPSLRCVSRDPVGDWAALALEEETNRSGCTLIVFKVWEVMSCGCLATGT